MADNLSLEDLNVLRESGASAGIQGLIHHDETLPLYERYRYSDLGDVVLSEQLLRSQSASDAADIAQLENALVWMVAERYAHDRTLRQQLYRAYSTKAAEFGKPDWNNGPLIVELLKLRRSTY